MFRVRPLNAQGPAERCHFGPLTLEILWSWVVSQAYSCSCVPGPRSNCQVYFANPRDLVELGPRFQERASGNK